MVLACVITVCFAFSSCEENLFKEDPEPAITITGLPRVDETLTATSSGSGFNQGQGYEWYWTTSPSLGGSSGYYNSSPGTSIGTGNTIIVPVPPKADSIYYIYARRYNAGKDAFVSGTPIGPIQTGNQ